MNKYKASIYEEFEYDQSEYNSIFIRFVTIN